ncbi:hypothetical protein HDU67_007468 [Dinochytrium kinnereticum]|nr:hypothetical protein HDU67_007468 [Dinochytrium kinnereticum]
MVGRGGGGGGIVTGSQRTCEGAAVCCLNTGKCNLADYCDKELVESIEDLKIEYPPKSDALCVGKAQGEKICVGKSAAAVCQYSVISSEVSCASGMLCCPSTNQCDFAFNCDGIPPVKIPDSALVAKSECSGMPPGARICSDDGYASLSCDGKDGTLFESTCRFGKCCKDTGFCPRRNAACANPCDNIAEGQFVCGTPKQGFPCVDGAPSEL